MLVQLSIQNVVLIEKLVIDFHSGLCVLTGETGAGKSVLLDSLGLALGVRAESGLVRSGATDASVTASFQIEENHTAYTILKDADITIEDDLLLLRRTLNSKGKSRAFINDHPVSIALLKSVGDTLVEIHGQFETQGLLNPSTHRSMLDMYAEIDNEAIEASWREWKRQQDELSELERLTSQANAEEEYLRQSLEDLNILSPEKGEEEKLSLLREQLKHRESVIQALSAALNYLNTENDPVQSAWAELDKISAQASDALMQALEALSRASVEISESISLIQNLLNDIQDADQNIEDIDDRLYALRMQARKHQCNCDDLPTIVNALSLRLSKIENADEELSTQRRLCDEARAQYLKISQKISEKRHKTGERLNALVQAELAPLKLDKAQFVTHIEALDEVEWGIHGIDRVRFLVSTNPGRAPGPIHKIASGGEMSRFMLALKVIIAQAGSTHSFIFDEVDAGIGGATADAVGERLSRLAREKQVLVVTHAPQVAARANHHWIVQKSGGAEVKTDIIPLHTRAEKCEEIARMLAGADITAEARAAADKLLGAAA